MLNAFLKVYRNFAKWANSFRLKQPVFDAFLVEKMSGITRQISDATVGISKVIHADRTESKGRVSLLHVRASW